MPSTCESPADFCVDEASLWLPTGPELVAIEHLLGRDLADFLRSLD